jgi:hypothetical protein
VAAVGGVVGPVVVVVEVVVVIAGLESLESPRQPLSSAVKNAQKANPGITKCRLADMERKFMSLSPKV